MNPGEAALRFVLDVHGRLRNMALLEAVTGPAAFVLLSFAGVLALGRYGSLSGMPDRLLVLVFVTAGFAALARLIKTMPRVPDAARHLDRELAAKERWTTVLEAASSDLAVAEWAARGAMDGLQGRTVREVVPYRPPAAAVPLLLAVVLVSSMVLLPTPAVEAASAHDAANSAASAVNGDSGGAPAVPGRARPSRDPRVLAIADALRPSVEDPDASDQVMDDLAARAAKSGNDEVRRSLEAAQEAKARGDQDAMRTAILAAAESLYGPSVAGAGGSVDGATGEGEAARGSGSTTFGHDSMRFPVRPRAREAVRRYYEALGSEVR